MPTGGPHRSGCPRAGSAGRRPLDRRTHAPVAAWRRGAARPRRGGRWLRSARTARVRLSTIPGASPSAFGVMLRPHRARDALRIEQRSSAVGGRRCARARRPRASSSSWSSCGGASAAGWPSRSPGSPPSRSLLVAILRPVRIAARRERRRRARRRAVGRVALDGAQGRERAAGDGARGGRGRARRAERRAPASCRSTSATAPPRCARPRRTAPRPASRRAAIWPRRSARSGRAPTSAPRRVVVVSPTGGSTIRPRTPRPRASAPWATRSASPSTPIATTKNAPADASVRRVATAGAAVAHVPLPLRVDVGCDGGLPCDELTVTAKRAPRRRAAGAARDRPRAREGRRRHRSIFTVTLERAGTRIVEVAIGGVSGDVIPENDRRLVAIRRRARARPRAPRRRAPDERRPRPAPVAEERRVRSTSSRSSSCARRRTT